MALSSGQDKIEIVVEVDSKTGIASIKQLGEEQDKLSKKTKEAGKVNDQFFDSFAKGAAQALGAYLSFSTAVQSIKAGARFDDLSNGFENLAKKAGVSAKEIQSSFDSALGGTISKADQLVKLNTGLIAGLDPASFNNLAQAARSLADNMGQELAPTLETVFDSMVKGQDRALKLMGVQVDLKSATDSYARSISTTSDKLTEAQTLEVSRAAILEALNKKQKELGDVTNDAADNLDAMQSQLHNVGLEVSRAIANNPELNKTLSEMVKALKEMDWSGAIDGISKFTSLVGSSVGVISEFVGWLTEPKGLINGLRVADALLHGASLSTAEYSASVQASADAQIQAAAAAKKKNDQFTLEVLGMAQAKITAEQKAKATKEEIELLKKRSEEDKRLQKAQKDTEEAVKKSAETQKQKAKEATEVLKKYAEQVLKAAENAKELNSTKGLKDTADQIKDIYNNAKDLGLPFSKAQEEILKLREGLIAAGMSAENFGIAINKSLTEIKTDTTGAENLGDDIGAAIVDGITSAINEGFSRESLSGLFESLGGSIGSDLGADFGKSIGLEKTGAAIGNALGKAVGKAIGDGLATFGKDSAGTEAKKQLDKILSETFQDFQFSGNQNPLAGAFSQMSADAQAQFQLVGDALATALGVATDSGVNLGVVLANNNVTLSELSSIIDATGQSFDTLSQAMYQAFYDGEISVIDLQNRLEQLMGIIDGSSTFPDLGAAVKAALTQDGRQLLGAIKSIGAEAQQLGATTLPQMADILINRFGFAAEVVKGIMASMSAAGINAVADLASATQGTLVSISANIKEVQAGGDPTHASTDIKITTPKVSGVGSKPSGSSSRNSTQSAADKRKAEEERTRQSIVRLFNEAQNSAAGKALEQAVADKKLTDGEYAAKLQTLVNSVTAKEKAVSDAQKTYSESVRKNTKDQSDNLKKLISAKNDLEKTLAAPASTKTDSIYAQLDNFAQKFAGNVELIKIAAKGLKIDFKDLKEQALQAFQSGAKTFAEAKKALDDSQGIAGKQGAVGQAVKNFLQDGTRGGIFSERDLKAIATEAKELGATTLDNVSEAMLGQGIDPAIVQKLFIGFKNNGIDAISDLENITTEKVIALGAAYQDLGLPFQETTQSMRDQLNELDKLLNQPRKMTVEVEAIVNEDVRSLLGLPASGGGGYSQTSPGVPEAGSNNKPKPKAQQKVANKYVSQGTYRNAQGGLVHEKFSFI